MRQGVVFSAGMHVSLIALAIVGLPHFFQPEPMDMVPVAVEVVSIDDLAKPPPKPAAEPPKPEAKTPPPPAPPEPPKAAEPPPPAPPAPPPPVAEPVPPKPEPAPPKPEVAEKPKPKPKPVVEKAPEPPPPVVPATEAPKRKPKPPPDAFQTLLKNLEAEKQKRRTEVKPDPKAQEQPQVALNIPRVEQPPQRSPIDTRRISATLQQLVAQQVSQCWSLPAGAKEIENMRIGVRIVLNPDGSLRGIPVPDDTARMNRDQVYRTVAESALRALRNPRCTPLRLPLEYYDMWKDITFIFDPKEMVGQ